jgi:hypothetical protein
MWFSASPYCRAWMILLWPSRTSTCFALYPLWHLRYTSQVLPHFYLPAHARSSHAHATRELSKGPSTACIAVGPGKAGQACWSKGSACVDKVFQTVSCKKLRKKWYDLTWSGHASSHVHCHVAWYVLFYLWCTSQQSLYCSLKQMQTHYRLESSQLGIIWIGTRQGPSKVTECVFKI